MSQNARSHTTGSRAIALAFLASCRAPGGGTEAVTSGAPAVDARPLAAPPPTVDWIDLGVGRFAVRATTSISLAADAQIQKKTAAGSFAAVSLEPGFRLTDECGKPTGGSDCRTLSAGEVIVPAAWDGADCAGACCPTRDADPLHPGVHRWVVSGCPTSASSASTPLWESPEFTIPSLYRVLYRARAAAHLHTARVARLDALSDDEADTTSPDRIAGYATIAAEVPLSEQLVSELAQWLSGPGFKDDVLRRCKRANAFGFRGVRRAPGLDLNEATEIAVDLHCNSIAVVYQEGAMRRRMDAFFDPSRPVLQDILERALPAAHGGRDP